MTGFSLPENYTDNPERLVRRVRPRVIPPLAIIPAQEPISEAPLFLEAMAEKTLREFSVPSTDNVANGPNTTSFPEAGLQRTPRLSVLGPEKFGDG